MGLLAGSALAIWLTGTLGFTDSISCAVQGVVEAQPGHHLVFTRVDTCLSISQRIEQNKVLLWSPHRWAVVTLPAGALQGRLSYRWGAPVAYLEQEAIPVTWGLLLRG
jgi:hypothetical protein